MAVLVVTSAMGIFAARTTESASAQPENHISSLDLAEIRDVHSLSVSPDGAWVAFQVVQADPEHNRYNTAWYIAPTRRGRGGEGVQRIADAGDLVPGGVKGIAGLIGGYFPAPPPAWSPDGMWIAYLRWDGAGSQIWRSTRSGDSVEQLTHGDAHVRALVYARDGTRILYETESSRAQINAAHAAEGRAGFLFDGRFLPAYDRQPVFPADTRFVEGTSRRHSDVAVSARHIWAFSLASRRERLATNAERAEFEALTMPAWPDGERSIRGGTARSTNGALAWTEAHDPVRQGFRPPLTIFAQLAGTHTPFVCAARECANQAISNLWWRSDGELVFERREGPQDQDTGLYAWRVGGANVRTILRTRGLLTGHLGASETTCGIALGRLICFYEEAAVPRRLIAIDLDTGVVEVLYDPNPDFARLNLGPPPQRLEFPVQQAGDATLPGRKVLDSVDSGAESYLGYLVLPPNHRRGVRLPLVIVTYRCFGFLRGGTGDEYPIYPFAAEGFAVLCMELDGDLERKSRLDAQAHQRWAWGPGVPAKRLVLDGLAAAITQLSEMQLIDPNRVGITGQSFGAQIVAWALTDMPRLAAAINSGDPDGTTTYYLTAESMRDHLENFYQLPSPFEAPERWRELSFSPHVERVRAPLLINVADHELMDALEPVVALRDSGRAVEMYVHPDEYHWKWQPSHRLAIYERNIDWMNFWLRGVEDEALEKAAQYQRWRAMRTDQCEHFTGPAAPWYCLNTLTKPTALPRR